MSHENKGITFVCKSYPGIGDSCEQIHGSNTRQISVQSSVNTTETREVLQNNDL